MRRYTRKSPKSTKYVIILPLVSRMRHILESDIEFTFRDISATCDKISRTSVERVRSGENKDKNSRERESAFVLSRAATLNNH